METAPDSVLAILESIDPSSLSESAQAFYHLLDTQAKIRYGEIVDSDSGIAIAWNYYINNGPAEKRMRASFYKSKVDYNRGDMPSSMANALDAYEIAHKTKSPLWIARSAEVIGDIYFDVYNYSEAEKYTKEAAANYLLADKITNHRYALAEIGAIYNNEERYDEALRLLDSLETTVLASEPVDSGLADYIFSFKFASRMHTDDLDALKDDLARYLQGATSSDEIVDAAIKESIIDFQSGAREQATDQLLSAAHVAQDDQQLIRVLFASYIQAAESKYFERATRLADSLLVMQSNITKELLSESVTAAQRDYYANSAITEKNKARSLFVILIAVVAVFFIIAIAVLYVYRLKRRERLSRIETYISEINDLKSINENERNTSVQLFRKQWNTFNSLCNKYVEAIETGGNGNMLLNRIESEINRLSARKSVSEIENSVNKYMDNIMVLLREECPSLKEEDFKLATFIYAGFSSRAVCLFNKISYNNFYVRKSRLKKLIEESSAPHKAFFVENMN